MSPNFAFLLVCFQACLIQNVYSACLGTPAVGLGYGGIAGPALGGLGLAGPYGAAGCGAAYGGAGAGNVAVAGALPVAGTTALAGQVPIIGAVQFGGIVPAAGAVTIAGSCACGCDAIGPFGIY